MPLFPKMHQKDVSYHLKMAWMKSRGGSITRLRPAWLTQGDTVSKHNVKSALGLQLCARVLEQHDKTSGPISCTPKPKANESARDCLFIFLHSWAAADINNWKTNLHVWGLCVYFMDMYSCRCVCTHSCKTSFSVRNLRFSQTLLWHYVIKFLKKVRL